MYRNVSRSVSPSAQSAPLGRVAKVDLDCIEALQDAWCRRNETPRDPPPPPLLNSPRSLRVCEVADVSPQTSLLKLSLKQHLFRVLGNPHALTTLPNPTTAEYRELLQAALRAFREATVGIGTSQEKLAAFIAFKSQEELRVPLLATLRDLRRQLTADDLASTNRKPPNHRPTTTTDTWRESTVNSQQSSVSARKATLPSPISVTAAEEEEHTRRQYRSQGSRRNSAETEVSITVPMRRGIPATPHATPTTAAAAAPSPANGDESGDFTPPVTRYGGLPYKPRDVSLLNSSYFSNRSIPSNASNPSRAPLPASAPATPTPSLLDTSSQTAGGKPERLAASTQPSHMREDTSIDTSHPDADCEVSLRSGPANEALTERSIHRQDLSVVSIDSSQLERLLSVGEPTASAAEVLAARRLAADHAGLATTAAHTVVLFHADAAAEVEGSAPDKATTASEPDAISTASTPSTARSLSQQLTRRAGRAYTNHTRSASLLVPNIASQLTPSQPPSRDELRPGSATAGSTSASRTPERRVHENGGKATARPSTQPQQQWLPPPPAITLAEQREGFVYYCANPSNTATRFCSGAAIPPSVVVEL